MYLIALMLASKEGSPVRAQAGADESRMQPDRSAAERLRIRILVTDWSDILRDG